MRRFLPTFGPTAALVAASIALFLIAPYALLVMAPALALAWLVAVGLFTGEQAIRWIRRVARRRRQVQRPTPAPAPRHTRRDVPRGGLLIAAALASRPPPAVA